MSDVTTTPNKREVLPVKIDDMGLMKPANLQEAIEMSKLIAHSGFVPKTFEGNPGAVLVCLQMGHELGLAPMAALRSIAVINNRPALYGDGMLAVVISHPDCEDIVETFDDAAMTATCVVKRRGHQPKTAKFSMTDAKQAGLAGKQGTWSQYTKRMLQMRARGFALRDAFPDALSGIISVEEARDIPAGIDGDGVIDAGKLDAGDHSFGFTKKPEVKEEPAAPVAQTEKTAAQVMDEKDREAAATKKKQQTLPMDSDNH